MKSLPCLFYRKNDVRHSLDQHHILVLREKENLYDILRERMERVYGRVLIGYGGRLSEYSDGSYFVIGPEKQLNNLEEYIATVGEEQPVYRIYSRDFWITK